jgi:hypothetical protein
LNLRKVSKLQDSLGAIVEYYNFTDNEEDFDFIDPSILEQFKRTSISIEKIQKDIFNFDEKG